jgi:anaerobic selenocysteine-containing dehydrogenase
MELCGWGRYLASIYTFGASVPGAYLPDIDHAGCILYWGYNPAVARLAHATSTVAALNRGARLIVVDPRRAGLASRADHWLRVRPGTDGALALAMPHVLIDQGWFDRDFVSHWTNGPLLVRTDNGRLLREADVTASGDANRFVAWDASTEGPVIYDPALGAFESPATRPALFGEVQIATTGGAVTCRPAFQLTADLCRRHAPHIVQPVCGVEADEIERAARTLWHSRPVAYYVWSGVEQHSNATQTIRAISQLYALTGSFDARGGNVLLPAVPTGAIAGDGLLPEQQRAKALGLSARPLGPSRWEFVTSDELYTPPSSRGRTPSAAWSASGRTCCSPTPTAGGDARRWPRSIFYLHADLFMNPTAEMADIVLPVASPFETEGLKVGFEVSEAA